VRSIAPLVLLSFFFFFYPTPSPHTYTLSLHDALPIFRRRPSQPLSRRRRFRQCVRSSRGQAPRRHSARNSTPAWSKARLQCFPRSEEHTSELQSRSDLVCRLLLEKKKQK